jgi:ubiquitin carboxyl-terminal hydrolase 8
VLLEELATNLQQRDVENQRDDILQDAMNKYPPVDVLDSVSSPIMNNETQINNDSSFLLDGLPSVPTHAPDKSSPSAPVTRKTRQSPPKFMKMPEPESNPLSNIPPLPKINNNNDNNGLFQLPKPSNFPFPSTLVVDPKTLATWIVKKNGVEQTPNVLILDVRPRYVFDQGFIKHKWIAQIEPLVLKQE